MNKRLSAYKLSTLILAGLLLSVLIPVLLGCLFTVPSADDYEYATVWAHYNGAFFQYLTEEISREYMTWQGNFLAVFATKMPVIYYGGVTGLRVYLLAISVLFFLTVGVFVRIFVRFVKISADSRMNALLLLLTGGLFYLLGTNYLSEVFYWFCGLQTYTMPFCFVFISLSCSMAYQLNEKKKYLIVGAICAFFSGGAALNVVAFFCAVLLFGVLYNLIILRKTNKSIFIGIAALASALINVSAPGNFVRHARFESGLSIGKALAYTAIRLINVIYSELRSGVVLFVIVPAFFIGFKYLKNSSFQTKYPGLISLYAACAVFITDFPVILGYSDIEIGVRGGFVEHLSVAVFFSLMFMYWGGWFAKKELLHFSNTSLLILGIVFVVFLTGPYVPGAARNFTPYKMIVHMFNGDFKEISDKEVSVIRQIEESATTTPTVQVTKDRKGQWVNFMRSGTQECAELPAGMGICLYYDKDAVRVEYVDP